MGIRRIILTSGGLASAIGICLAILSAGTLVVFSVIAARVGLDDISTDASVASPRDATKGPPAAITFPATEEPSEENQGTQATSNASLLDIVGSALDESTSTVAADATVEPVTPDDSAASIDAGPEQVASLAPDIDLGGDSALAERLGRSASRIKRGRDTRPADEKRGPNGKEDEGGDPVAARKDDEDDPDHGDEDDDDDDSDSSRSRGGSSDGSRDGRVARVHAKASTAKAKAKGHSKGVDVNKAMGKKDKGHGPHHGDDDSDSSDS
jgi:hypothetical protein